MSIDFIKIDPDSRKPKFRQIVDIIKSRITSGTLNIDERLPSINDFSEEFYLSRDTVQKAYDILKAEKIIVSVNRKGFYVNRAPLVSKLNILYLVNKLSSYKMLTYSSFIEALGVLAHVDFQVYHCDESIFLDILNKNIGAYNYYVIMPHFKTANLNHTSITEKAAKTIQQIPKKNLVILDIKEGAYNAQIEIYQDFEKDIYKALLQGLDKIKKYNNLVLVYPSKSIYPYPKGILHGFRKFCSTYDLDFETYEEIDEEMILKKGDLFLVITDSDLVTLLKKVRNKKLKLGKDIGVISYNDTALKELLGIAVVSTDFKNMGKIAANMILNKEAASILNDFNFISRPSL